MLIAALVLTVLGFGFLVAAVATGEVMWAWACIVVGGLGLVLLIVDVVTGGTSRDDRDGRRNGDERTRDTDEGASGDEDPGAEDPDHADPAAAGEADHGIRAEGPVGESGPRPDSDSTSSNR